jgi:hypothetical protein
VRVRVCVCVRARVRERKRDSRQRDVGAIELGVLGICASIPLDERATPLNRRASMSVRCADSKRKTEAERERRLCIVYSMCVRYCCLNIF